MSLYILKDKMKNKGGQAVIAFDASSEAHDTSGIISSLTFSHTTSGTNRILFVGFFAGVTDIITGVTYAGTAMTLVNKIQAPGGRWAYLYDLVAPAVKACRIRQIGRCH